MSVKLIGSRKDRIRRGIDAAFALALPGGRAVAGALRLVDGYLYPHEAVFLYWVARSVPKNGVVVEIGSMRGRSTLCLAAGVRDGRQEPVYAVDPHRYGTLEELRENISHFGLSGHVHAVSEASLSVAAAWNRPVRAVFVDGDHSFAAADADVKTWSAHLVPGGLLLLHDSTELSGMEGPRRVARISLRTDAMFDKTGAIGSITWARRSGDESDWTPPEHGKRILDGIIGLLKRLRRSIPG